MKITRFVATAVHGFLPISIEFFADLTFLTGLNGSGKTSALRILMGMLTPTIEELASITFQTAEVTIADTGGPVVISATRNEGSMQLRITGVAEELSLTASDLHVLLEPRNSNSEEPNPVQGKLASSAVYRAIVALSTPMFLGLDRRSVQGDLLLDPNAELARRRQLAMRRGGIPAQGSVPRLVAGGLADVEMLVQDTLYEVRKNQEQLDERLRIQLLLSAFRYTHTDRGIRVSGGAPTRPGLGPFDGPILM